MAKAALKQPPRRDQLEDQLEDPAQKRKRTKTRKRAKTLAPRPAHRDPAPRPPHRDPRTATCAGADTALQCFSPNGCDAGVGKTAPHSGLSYTAAGCGDEGNGESGAFQSEPALKTSPASSRGSEAIRQQSNALGTKAWLEWSVQCCRGRGKAAAPHGAVCKLRGHKPAWARIPETGSR